MSPLTVGLHGSVEAVHGELGVHGFDCAVSGTQDWTSAHGPNVTSSSSALGCCWLA